MKWEKQVAAIGSEMHAKWCCLSLRGYLVYNVVSHGKTTALPDVLRKKQRLSAIGYGRTVPWITVEHSAEISQVDLILDHGL